MKQMTRARSIPVLFIYLILYYTVNLDLNCSSGNLTERNKLASADVMYWSNRSFNMLLPRHTPGIWHLCRPGEEGIWLSESSRGWGIWTAPSISCKIFGVASYGGRGVRGFSWKRLCLCGQLVTRKGLKQALCRFWSIWILKFLILD